MLIPELGLYLMHLYMPRLKWALPLSLPIRDWNYCFMGQLNHVYDMLLHPHLEVLVLMVRSSQSGSGSVFFFFLARNGASLKAKS